MEVSINLVTRCVRANKVVIVNREFIREQAWHSGFGTAPTNLCIPYLWKLPLVFKLAAVNEVSCLMS